MRKKIREEAVAAHDIYKMWMESRVLIATFCMDCIWATAPLRFAD